MSRMSVEREARRLLLAALTGSGYTLHFIQVMI
jgi:hypothetical protein